MTHAPHYLAKHLAGQEGKCSSSVFARASLPVVAIPIRSGYNGQDANKGCAQIAGSVRECDSESKIPALASGLPALPNRLAQGHRFSSLGTSSGHLLFLAS